MDKQSNGVSPTAKASFLERLVMPWRVRVVFFSLLFFWLGVDLALAGNTMAAILAAVIEMAILHETSCEELIETQRRYIGTCEALLELRA